MTDPARTRNTSKIICPFCGYEYEESYELIGLDLVECDACGARFELETEETVTYTTRKPDWLRRWRVHNRNRILEAGTRSYRAWIAHSLRDQEEIV